ncbi:MAG: ABC transporter permease subunit [Planctomycetota bacterium]|nr:ABC transporter permease subunit [Planctomycetota bacterium]
MNPVLSRELKCLNRGNFLYATRGAYIGLLCLVVLVGWKTLSAQLGVISYFNEPRIPFDQISTLGRTLFRFFSIGELGLLLLISPALTSQLLTQERERRTLEIMIASPMSELRMAWAKLQVGFIHLLLLLIAGMPVLGVTALLGGVSLREIALVHAYLAMIALMGAAAGLLASSSCRKAATAILAGYLIFGLFLVIPSPDVWRSLGLDIHLQQILSQWGWSSPMESLLAVTEAAPRWNPVKDSTDPWDGVLLTGGPVTGFIPFITVSTAAPLIAQVVFVIGLTAAILGICAWQLKRQRVAPQAGVAAEGWQAVSDIAGFKIFEYLLGMFCPFARRCWCEQKGFLSGCGALVLALSVIAPLHVNSTILDLGDESGFLLYLLGLLPIGITAMLAAANLARERERRTLELMRAGPKGSAGLMAALFLTSVVQMACICLYGLFFSLVFIDMHIPRLLWFWITVAIIGCGMVTLGVAISCLVLNPTRAMLTALGCFVVLILLPQILVWLEILFPSLDAAGLKTLASFLSPAGCLNAALHWPRSFEGMEYSISMLIYLGLTALVIRVVILFREGILRRQS